MIVINAMPKIQLVKNGMGREEREVVRRVKRIVIVDTIVTFPTRVELLSVQSEEDVANL